jgi:hypothetical protein
MAMAARYLILEKGKQAGLAGALKREGDTFFMVKPWD